MYQLNWKILVLGQIVVLLTMLDSNPSFAHGTLIVPQSRIHFCRFGGNPENHSDPACRAAIALGGTQAIYDWNGVRQGNAAGRHRELIPNGELCSGGNQTFHGMDLLREDWHATPISPDIDGRFEFIYHATAPHSTRTMQFYITRDGWDPSQPLAWNDLDEFCHHNSVTLSSFQGKSVYRMTCDLPRRNGRHVIFNIWQRSDSPEAFYACADVILNGDGPHGNPEPILRPIGRLTAADNLADATRVTLRVLDENSRDLERITVDVTSGRNAPALWVFDLAQAVNAQSQWLRIGVASDDGSVIPVEQATGNIVYNLSPRNLNFVVDKQTPDQPDGPDQPDTGGVDFNYPDGIGGYQPGTIVRASDGNRYQCRPFPNSGWCNQAPFYYAPGTGSDWSDAWLLMNGN